MALKARVDISGTLFHLGQRVVEPLASAIPGWFYLPGFRRDWAQPVTVSRKAGQQIEFPDLPKGTLVDVFLDASFFLMRDFVFPSAVRANLDKAIELQVRQAFASKADDIQHRSRVADRTSERIKVQVFVLARQHLVDVVTAAETAGLHVRTLRVSDAPQVQPFVDNRRATDRPRRAWMAATLALFVAGCASVWAVEYAKTDALRTQLALLSSQNEDLARQAVMRRDALQNADSEAAQVIADAKLYDAESSPLLYLLDLTDTLPDEVWISAVQIGNGEVVLSGMTSGDVAGVLQTLTALDWVQHAEMASPALFDRMSQSNRFDINLLINRDEGEQ